MGMSVGESKGGAMAEMNVVPLIDILLVLLIIFMVITPLTPHGLDALVPQPNPNQKQDVELENKTVVVQVLVNNKLKINNEDTTWEGLGPRLETIFKERAEKARTRMDANGDGKVSYDEVKNAQGRMHFDDPAAIDTNHDGDISADELEAAMKARREQFRAQREAQNGGSGAPPAAPPDDGSATAP